MTTPRKHQALLTWPVARTAIYQAVRKLDPRNQVRNPVMFVTMVGAAPQPRGRRPGRSSCSRWRRQGHIRLLH